MDVWADEQSFAALGQIIGPATQQAGLDAKPTAYPVQGMISHDGKQPLPSPDDVPSWSSRPAAKITPD